MVFPRSRGLVLHVGYQKAASTFLQRQVFDCLKDRICYASGASPKDGSIQIRDLMRAIKSSDEINYDKFLASHPQPILKAERPIVSNSGLVVSWGADRKAIARRLSDLFPNARILIVVRNQFDLIRSVYAKTLARSPWWDRRGINAFLDNPNLFAGYLGSSYSHPLNNLDYASVIETYREAFPAVYVIPAELIGERHPYAVEALAECLESESGEIVGLLDRPRVNVSTLPRRSRMNPHWKGRIRDASVEPNLRLQKLLPVDLAELGYPV